MAEDAKVVFGIEVDDSGVDRSLDAVGRKVKNGASKWESMVSGIWQGVGQRVGQGLISAATSGIKAVFRLGTQFETSMAKASTLIDTTQHDMKQLGDSILEVSTRTGVAASELGDAMYSALSASIPLGEEGADMMLYLERCAMLAKAGFTDVDTAVTATAKVLNAYGMDVSETERVQTVLMQTQNLGITTVGELGSVLAQVTPTAAAFGLSFEQVGASLATMTAAGTPTAQAVTQLRQLLVELGKEGTAASKALKASTRGTEWADMSFTELLNTGMDLNQVLSMMQGYATRTGVSMLDLFGSVEAGNAALALSGDHSETFISNLAAMSTETDVVGEAFEKVTDTTSERWNKFTNALSNAGITLFEGLSPAFDELTTWLTSEETLSAISNFASELAAAFDPQSLVDLANTAVDTFSTIAEAIDAMWLVADPTLHAFAGLVDFLTGDTEGAKRNQKAMMDSRLGTRIAEGMFGFANPIMGAIFGEEVDIPFEHVWANRDEWLARSRGGPIEQVTHEEYEAMLRAAEAGDEMPVPVDVPRYTFSPIVGATETQSAPRVYGPALPEDENWGMAVPYDQPIEQATVEAASVELVFPGQPGWQTFGGMLQPANPQLEWGDLEWGEIGEQVEGFGNSLEHLNGTVTDNSEIIGDEGRAYKRLISSTYLLDDAVLSSRGGVSGLGSTASSARGSISSLASAADIASGRLASISKGGGGKGAWDALGKSVGLNYVPYDEYPALLHKGEQVLTAPEASAYNLMQAGRMGGGGIDYDQLAASMASLQISMDGRRVGHLTERGVSAAQAARYSRVTRSGGM